ncbi:unnamed protein product, partial [Amoebophrya sp. A25]
KNPTSSLSKKRQEDPLLSLKKRSKQLLSHYEQFAEINLKNTKTLFDANRDAMLAMERERLIHRFSTG